MEIDYELINNEKKRRYEFQVEGKIAFIDYMVSVNQEIYFTHTEVPLSLGGRGIGTQLVEKALIDIKGKGLKLMPLCPFVAKYIKVHPEWKEIVVQGVNIK